MSQRDEDDIISISWDCSKYNLSCSSPVGAKLSDNTKLQYCSTTAVNLPTAEVRENDAAGFIIPWLLQCYKLP